MTLERKLHLYIIVTAVFLLAGTAFWQYIHLRSKYKSEIAEELDLVKVQWNRSVGTYNAMLQLLAKQIVKHRDESSMRAILKRFYINPERNGAMVTFGDIIWRDYSTGFSIDRYGTIQEEVSHLDLHKILRTSLEKLHLFNVKNTYNLINANELHFILGVTDQNKRYLGYLSMPLDVISWMKRLEQKLTKINQTANLIDSEKKVLFPTTKPAISDKNLIFVHTLKLDPYPYFIQLGYSKSRFYKKVLTSTYPLAVGICIIFSAIFLIQTLHSRNLRNEIGKEFVKEMNALTKLNTKYLNKNSQITCQLNKQSSALKTMIKQHEELLKAQKCSAKERQKLEAQLGERITESITEVKEIAKILAETKEGTRDIFLDEDKQIEMLAKIHATLAYLSLFCVGKGKTEEIDLQQLIDHVLKIYSVEIWQNGLSTNIKIHKEVKFFRFDKLLLQQLLANLLRESVLGARPNGKINIEISKSDHNVKFNIQDNGFGVPEAEITKHIDYPTSCLSLNLKIIKEIVMSFGGNLTIDCIVGKGKTIILTLPYQYHENSNIVVLWNAKHH